MPSVSVSRIIDASLSDVWAALSDIENARRWNTSWTSIEITSPQHHGIGTTFRAQTESDETYEFKVTEWAPPERIAFSPIREEAESYALTLESQVFQLHETEDGQTRVELTANASTRGPRGRLVGLFFWPGYQKHGLDTALDALQALFEEGDERADGQPRERGSEAGAAPPGD